MARQVSVRRPADEMTTTTTRRGGHVALQGLVVIGLVVLAFGFGLVPSLVHSHRQFAYTSTEYHFNVNYPVGWSASTIQNPSEVSPLMVVITQTHTSVQSTPTVDQSQGPLVPTLTISVFSLSNQGIAANAQALPSNPSMRRITLAGFPAYQAVDEDEQAPGAPVAVVHTDYYLVHGAYEYQISTDAISNDPDATAALQTMLKGFTILP